MTTEVVERPPQRRRGKVPRAEAESRTEFAIELLSQGLPKHKIKAEMKKRFGIAARTIERYLQRARDHLVAETGRDREELRGESYATYQAILSDPNATLRDRLAARRQLDRLLGLRPPSELTVEVQPPAPARSEFDLLAESLSNEELEALLAIGEKLDTIDVEHSEVHPDALRAAPYVPSRDPDAA